MNTKDFKHCVLSSQRGIDFTLSFEKRVRALRLCLSVIVADKTDYYSNTLLQVSSGYKQGGIHAALLRTEQCERELPRRGVIDSDCGMKMTARQCNKHLLTTMWRTQA